MTFLLDLNLLLALAWPSHVHHDPAHAWFEREGSPDWATCPLTQLGFVRLSSNSAFTTDAVSPTAALSLLRDITAMDGHRFWPDDVDCVSATFPTGIQLTGHRQVTDAYLLSLARARSGCLATLDRRMNRILPRSDRPNPHLRIVEASWTGVESAGTPAQSGASPGWTSPAAQESSWTARSGDRRSAQ